MEKDVCVRVGINIIIWITVYIIHTLSRLLDGMLEGLLVEHHHRVR